MLLTWEHFHRVNSASGQIKSDTYLRIWADFFWNFRLGGEFGGTSSLLAEFAAERRSRAFWMSLANIGVPLGAMAASGMMLVMSKSFATTGWRIAMLFSLGGVIPALFARYKLTDSPLFERLKRQEQLAALPSLAVLKRHSGSIILVALVVSFMHMDGFVTGTYFISFMGFAGIPLATTAMILMLSRVGDVAGVLVSGPFADLCKRRTAAYVAVGLTTLLSYPFVLAVLRAGAFCSLLFCRFLSVSWGSGCYTDLPPFWPRRASRQNLGTPVRASPTICPAFWAEWPLPPCWPLSSARTCFRGGTSFLSCTRFIVWRPCLRFS